MSYPAITDLLLDKLARTIGAVPPERGGALIGTYGGEMLFGFVEDHDGDYTGVSYDPSAQITEHVQRLEDLQIGFLAGTVHTHPAGIMDPSGPDRYATERLLELNHKMTQTYVAIMTKGQPLRPHDVAASGHRVAVHRARRMPNGKTEISPVAARVLPIGAHLADIDGIEIGDCRSMIVDGESVVGVGVRDTLSGTELVVAVDRSYPRTAPLVFTVIDGEPTSAVLPPWSQHRAAAPQLEQALRAVLRHRPSGLISRTGLGDGLKGTRVLIAGCGSVGSTAAVALARAGVGGFHLIDPDVVEETNLSRQDYTLADVGLPKVRALRDRLLAINPSMEISYNITELGDVTDLPNRVTEADLVFGATDDVRQQVGLLGHLAYRSNVPMVTAAMYLEAAAGEVTVTFPPADSPCSRCCIGGGATSGNRGDTDYSTGRIDGGTALAAPIGIVVNLAVMVATGLLANTPVSRRLGELIGSGQGLAMIGTSDRWGVVADIAGREAHQAFPQAVWFQVERDPACGTCVTASGSDARAAEDLIDGPTSASALGDLVDAARLLPTPALAPHGSEASSDGLSASSRSTLLLRHLGLHHVFRAGRSRVRGGRRPGGQTTGRKNVY